MPYLEKQTRSDEMMKVADQFLAFSLSEPSLAVLKMLILWLNSKKKNPNVKAAFRYVSV